MEQIYESFGTLDFDVFFSGPKKRWGWGWEVAWFIGKWHLWQEGASSSLPSCWQFIYHLCSRIYSHIYLYIIIHTYIYTHYIYTFKTFLCKLCKKFSVPTSIEQKQKKNIWIQILKWNTCFVEDASAFGIPWNLMKFVAEFSLCSQCSHHKMVWDWGLWNLLPACFNIFVESPSSVWPSLFRQKEKGIVP